MQRGRLELTRDGVAETPRNLPAAPVPPMAPVRLPETAAGPTVAFLEAFLEGEDLEPEGLTPAEAESPAEDEPVAEVQESNRTEETAEVGAGAGRPAIADGRDNPNSDDYRYKDIGHVPGSRKELAAQQIRIAARDGRQVRSATIDWEAIEQNPREARSLITKSNLFGQVDWAALRADGMEPGAGFLVDRVYAAIGKEPSDDSPQARKDYAFGLEILRDRLEACRTPIDVTNALDQLRSESEGHLLDPAEQVEMDRIRTAYNQVVEKIHAFRAEEQRLEAPVRQVQGEISQLEWDQGKRERRGWKRDPELDARIAEIRPRLEELTRALDAFRDQHPEAKETWTDWGSGRNTLASAWGEERHRLYDAMDTIQKAAAVRNLAENPLCRGWVRMGERFIGVLGYRSSRGSEAFRGHVATAKAGKIKDWSWSEKDVTRVATSTKESARFQLKVADRYERVGGRELSIGSSEDLRDAFGLKAVEYGNWVAEDFNSAKFHTERCGAGFADLADLLGVEDRAISLGGEMAMGFGSRGRGALGWRTSAPAASYFPEQRIIGLTKNAGGGTLGHEWAHALDNLLPELATGRPTRTEDMATESPELLPDGPLRAAMTGVIEAMTAGPHRHDEAVAYTGRDVIMARQNIDRDFSWSIGRPHIAQSIKEAGDVSKAVLAVQERFASQRDRDGNLKRSAKSAMKTWITLAAAHYGQNPDGGSIKVRAGVPQSRFAYEAMNLDRGSKTPYWATRHEMFARAFQAWAEDRLAAAGQQNDYLSWHADNKWYVDPIFGPSFPFPEGEERIRINAAIDRLVEAIRNSGVLTAERVKA